ncbi:hypothetical protein [Pseudodesulfovibrio sp.]|uniref:hypothetical protein n=1 Tax=Pseudodesulfovibrio sp. TaxID=2035812 RepID=UPI00260B6523|nr:hypothetical protein [Pseudodesulfovibrio sp.]
MPDARRRRCNGKVLTPNADKLGVMDATVARNSVRAFTGRPLHPAELDSLIDAARFGAAAMNAAIANAFLVLRAVELGLGPCLAGMARRGQGQETARPRPGPAHRGPARPGHPASGQAATIPASPAGTSSLAWIRRDFEASAPSRFRDGVFFPRCGPCRA